MILVFNTCLSSNHCRSFSFYVSLLFTLTFSISLALSRALSLSTYEYECVCFPSTHMYSYKTVPSCECGWPNDVGICTCNVRALHCDDQDQVVILQGCAAKSTSRKRRLRRKRASNKRLIVSISQRCHQVEQVSDMLGGYEVYHFSSINLFQSFSRSHTLTLSQSHNITISQSRSIALSLLVLR
jgi:hypothetical protein